ncbi:MAG: hypothetical protein HFG28_05710 [Eubacterium sp.]|nr:hypothetical protein [Eubacterium sp.]
MNQLLYKFNEYKSIANYQMEYELDNGDTIKVKLRQTDFPHLIGLHKLIDIPIIRQFNDKSNVTVSAKFIISKIKREQLLTENVIKHSNYFNLISKRYEHFTKDNILSLSYTDALIDFNADLICSSLKSKYILFEKKEQGYNHLCIAQSIKATKYVESFFYNSTDLYIRNQKLIKVKKIKIYDSKGNIYMEDLL